MKTNGFTGFCSLALAGVSLMSCSSGRTVVTGCMTRDSVVVERSVMSWQKEARDSMVRYSDWEADSVVMTETSDTMTRLSRRVFTVYSPRVAESVVTRSKHLERKADTSHMAAEVVATGRSVRDVTRGNCRMALAVGLLVGILSAVVAWMVRQNLFTKT